MSSLTNQQSIPPPHPYLTEPRLYISGVVPEVSDADLARHFETCVPMRPNIMRNDPVGPLNGIIDFKLLESAEKALATLQSRPLVSPAPSCVLYLSPFPFTDPPTSLPPPQAFPRLVKHLPIGTTDSLLYDLFRPFGPLASVRTQTGFGPETAVVEYWYEEDAKHAEEAMHCYDLGGNNIAVQIYQPRRTSGNYDFNTSAVPFVPSGTGGGTPSFSYSPQSVSGRLPFTPNYSPPRGSFGGSHSPSRAAGFVHGPGQQVQYAPPIGPGSGSQSGLIDPCNLFCKNLDSNLGSNDLFTHFRQFGQIVSARVMRNENGQSRGFGFVSFTTPEQAMLAMHTMNGQLIGGKNIQVRLHEPKQLRQEKLAQRFSGGGRLSGATSPVPSEGADSPGGVPDRARRGSGSYYNAALSGNLSLSYDELSSLSPVVQKEVLTGELSRRMKGLEVPSDDVDNIVDALLGLGLSEVVQGLHDPVKLADQINAVRQQSEENSTSPSPNGEGRSSGLLDPRSLSTSSAPEHPSTPRSLSALGVIPSGTSSPAGPPPAGSDKDRLLKAVSKLESDSTKAAQITELLLGLNKKERALCLFNGEYLRAKVAGAREVLEADDEEEDPVVSTVSVATAPAAPGHHPSLVVEPQPKAASAPPVAIGNLPSAPSTPPISTPTSQTTPLSEPVSVYPPTHAGSAPVASVPSTPVHTLASLAKLPAAEIVRIATSPAGSLTGLPLPKADPLVIKATDEFVDSLTGKPIQAQKQQVGEKLFRVIKAFGIKGSPKITIALLDAEDLRALCHLMNSYPTVLKEKVLLQTGAK